MSEAKGESTTGRQERTLEEPAPEAVGPAAEALRIEATLREATELSEAA